jgi:hypothetical protein
LALLRDFASESAELVWDVDFFGSVRLLNSGLEYREQSRHVYAIVEGDPLSASVRSDWTVEVGRGTWQTRVQTQSAMTADRDRFLVTNALEGYERNNRVFVKTWTAAIPRDFA